MIFIPLCRAKFRNFRWPNSWVINWKISSLCRWNFALRGDKFDTLCGFFGSSSDSVCPPDDCSASENGMRNYTTTAQFLILCLFTYSAYAAGTFVSLSHRVVGVVRIQFQHKASYNLFFSSIEYGKTVCEQSIDILYADFVAFPKHIDQVANGLYTLQASDGIYFHCHITF